MSFPNIPDTLYKLIIAISIGLFIYAEYYYNSTQEKFSKEAQDFGKDVTRYSKDFELFAEKTKGREWLKKRAPPEIAKALDDSGRIKREVLKTLSENEMKELKVYSDSFGAMLKWDMAELDTFTKRHKELQVQLYMIDWAEEQFKYGLKKANIYRITALVLFILGTLMWTIDDSQKRNIQLQELWLEQRKNLDLPRIIYSCQSCGRQFNSMVRHGKEDDGSKNYSFCADCYSNGQFKNPLLTAQQVFEEAKTKNLGLDKKKETQLKQKIFNLERWKPHNYT